MTFPEEKNINDLEKEKFLQDDEGKTTVRTTSRGEYIQQGLKTGGKMTRVPLDTNWVPLPATPLIGRNTCAVQNQSDNDGIILVNYIDTGDVGWRIWDGGYREFPIQGEILIYARMVSGTGFALIDEEA